MHLWKKVLRNLKVTVWCGFADFSLLWAPFSSRKLDSNLETVFVISDRYRELLKDNFIPHLQERKPLHFEAFIHNKAPPTLSHTPCHTSFLRITYEDFSRLNRYFHHEWSPKSPDLTHCDYGYVALLWLKTRIYRGRPMSLTQLKNAIQRHVSETPAEFFNVVHAVLYRITAVLISSGSC